MVSIDRLRSTLRLSVALSALFVSGPMHAESLSAGEVLYNGIVLPSQWPPKPEKYPSPEPVIPPYLKSPPRVIPIDLGRQLFVDDFLIEKTTLKRQFHRPKDYAANPVMEADQPWEQNGTGPVAMPFSDGVWYDPVDQRLKMFYMGGPNKGTCLAYSQDGIRWTKPTFDVVPGTNIVQDLGRDSSTVWLDLEEKDPTRRFKMFRWPLPYRWRLATHFSPDGIHWSDEVVPGGSGGCGDRTTVFYNPFRKVWVYSVRHGDKEQVKARVRNYCEHRDPAVKAWEDNKLNSKWVSTDRLDRVDRYDRDAQLYNLDATPYESVMLGLFSILREGPDAPKGRPKINEVCVGFSRDGFHWSRPDRRSFLPVSEEKGAWNWGNVQSVGGGCLVMGDRLYFYYGGRAGAGRGKSENSDSDASTGLAFLRRDGFASMNAGASGGTLTTRPLRFQGKHLFVNVASQAGDLRVEVLDEANQVIKPFTRENCLRVRCDKTLIEVHFRNAKDLSGLAGKPVRFRFHLNNARLYSFWMSPDASGASHGYVAGGGAGFTSNRDTVGAAAYEAVARIRTQKKP